MSPVMVNGLAWDNLSGRTVNNARFYLKNSRLRPPAGYSFERLAFFICAVEPLFQLFFALQHFEGDYSVWVRRALAALPEETELKAPDAGAEEIFKTNVAAAQRIDAFLRGVVPDVPMDGYVAMTRYRLERARLKKLEQKPFKAQRGQELLSALDGHALSFKTGEEFLVWKKFLSVPGRLGEDLREAFVDGRYHLNFSHQEFKDFIFALPEVPDLNSRLLGVIYEGLAMRATIFRNDADARRLGHIFTGPLAAYAGAYAELPKDVDLLSLFSLEAPDRMKELVKSVSGDLEAGWKDFFYIADYGPAEDRDFDGFDRKLDQCVNFLSREYRLAETLPDLWEDRYFKFLYLMTALWFKHCYGDRRRKE